MIRAEDIGYENELQENISIDDLRNEYQDGVIIWITGSGKSPEGKPGAYRCVLEFRGTVKYMEKDLPDATANQAMLLGATDAVLRINKPLRLYFVQATALGFAGAFKGKGANVALIQELYKKIKEKGCKMTEVFLMNGADEIKTFVYSCHPDQKEKEALLKGTQDRRNLYKIRIYEECIEKVLHILKENNVDPGVIRKIKEIQGELNGK